MTLDFAFRLIGMVIFALLGARIGLNVAVPSGLPSQFTSFMFGLVGVLFGLILTPWLTVRPVRFIGKTISEKPVDVLLLSFVGLIAGLLIGLLAAYPLSLLAPPFGSLLPAAVSIVAAYLGISIFTLRAREFWDVVNERFGTRKPNTQMTGDRLLLLDTSVLIDGRIVGVARTGFLGGTLIVPRFVLSELHQVADSSDTLRRNRGRRGLAKLNELQRDVEVPVRLVDDDFEGVADVDNKLVMLAIQMNALIVTNDYNLNRVAEAQNITVLNVNLLANEVRAVFIPGETFPIHVIQEGRDPDQGVGYLEDGTMVVIANGKVYMDRTINVTVTRLINRETGRMIFAEPVL
jgi:uncharacterized protein YacL